MWAERKQKRLRRKVRAEQRKDGRMKIEISKEIWESNYSCGNMRVVKTKAVVLQFLGLFSSIGITVKSISYLPSAMSVQMMHCYRWDPAQLISPLQPQPLQDLLDTRTSWTPEGLPRTVAANTSPNTESSWPASENTLFWQTQPKLNGTCFQHHVPRAPDLEMKRSIMTSLLCDLGGGQGHF